MEESSQCLDEARVKQISPLEKRRGLTVDGRAARGETKTRCWNFKRKQASWRTVEYKRTTSIQLCCQSGTNWMRMPYLLCLNCRKSGKAYEFRRDPCTNTSRTLLIIYLIPINHLYIQYIFILFTFSILLSNLSKMVTKLSLSTSSSASLLLMYLECNVGNISLNSSTYIVMLCSWQLIIEMLIFIYSSVYKDILSADVKRRNEAKRQWTIVRKKLTHLFSTVSKQIFDEPAVIKKYNITREHIVMVDSKSVQKRRQSAQ